MACFPMSVLPIGQSERVEASSRTAAMTLWAQGGLHPAPLSRQKNESLAVSRARLRAPR
jgi:hypothetical protein